MMHSHIYNQTTTIIKINRHVREQDKRRNSCLSPQLNNEHQNEKIIFFFTWPPRFFTQH